MFVMIERTTSLKNSLSPIYDDLILRCELIPSENFMLGGLLPTGVSGTSAGAKVNFFLFPLVGVLLAAHYGV